MISCNHKLSVKNYAQSSVYPRSSSDAAHMKQNIGMDVARPNYITKGSLLSSITRKTSCSSGWLRLVVQSIFALIIVASFIMIVIMAVKNPQSAPGLRPAPTVPLRCQIKGCRVICKEAPHFGEYEEDIIYAVMEADSKCNRVYLELENPYFTNSTLPHTWLSRLRIQVHQLSIIGGNLMHIPSGAFMAQFMGTIKSLVLQDIQIRTLESTSLVGLSNLRTFNILNSRIDGVQENVFLAIDDTLETLSITESGKWNPIDFTGFKGFERLTIVNLSYNNFNHILNKYSFVGLSTTKILYLNFCRITAIGAGTFDHLNNIDVLYLNNNMLSTVPPGLFNTIVGLSNPRPRINLQDNYWYCDCSVDDLRQLFRKGILLVDVKCTYPDEFTSMTFRQFEYVCNNDTDALYEYNTNIGESETYENEFRSESIYMNKSYCVNSFSSDSLKLISPVQNNECSVKKLEHLNWSELVDQHIERLSDNKNKWLRFSHYIKTDAFSVVQIGAMEEHKHYGLVWFQSICPHEIYCLDAIPYVLKLYDADPNARYIFCPIFMENGSIKNDDCVHFFEEKHLQASSHDDLQTFRVLLYLVTMILCSCFGAVAVYGLIRRKPTLLKGSKRILFVKHKNVEALVLPPKVPLRKDLIDSENKEIFTITSGHNGKLKLPNVDRMKSVRSDKSGSASYISAMQPTEDQLAEWRIKHHFNSDLSMNSELSWIDTSYYYSLDESDMTYESLK